MPMHLERLLIAATASDKWQQPARHHLQQTLCTLARSEICDQVGGGFFRYATDARWMIPHFEKMLCDNALLLGVYAQSCSAFGDPVLEEAARGIAHWALREMRRQDGVFCGSLTADTAGDEGGYYLWTTTELARLLDDRENALVHSLFDLDKLPNLSGHWHLHRERGWNEIVAELELDGSDAQALWALSREKLRAARDQRSRPAADSRVLTARNALMIRGLAMAARVFGDREYLSAAQEAMDFLQNRLWVNQRLYASWQDGKAQISAYLDDYVFTMDALLELLQIEWRDRDYRFLGPLAEATINNFEDTEHGGFYFTPHDGEQLIFRNKPLYDKVLPSGNGIAAKVFGRVGRLIGEPRYLDSARRTLLNAWASMLRQPAEHHSLLQARGECLQPPPHVLLKGDARMGEWRHAIQQQYGDRVFCIGCRTSQKSILPSCFCSTTITERFASATGLCRLTRTCRNWQSSWPRYWKAASTLWSSTETRPLSWAASQ
jgi:uncharacterized protein YyaL (SSP411 family)